MKESLISKIPLFAALPARAIHHLAESLRVVAFPANAILFREGEFGDRLLIVLAGKIEIIKALDTPEEHSIGTLGVGDYIGDMSLLNPDGKRTASARTRTPIQALEMTRPEFDTLVRRQPRLAYELTRVLSTRLTHADNVTIQSLQEKNRQLQQAYRELRAAHEQIVEKEKLERELQVAREIQESILPRELPIRKGFDFGARMIPTRAVGGDLFDFVALDDTRLGIAIADVSDKGVPAAIFMALTRSLVRAQAMRFRSPRRVLQIVNHLLLDMNTANMFVTIVYGVLDYTTREFHYARAGHPAPLIFGARPAPIEPPLKPSQPLGLFLNIPLDVQRLKLAKGDVLILFTDGITEAMNEQGELFGAERLMKFVSTRRGDSAQALCDRVIETVSAYRGAAAQSDDITLAAVRVR